MENNQKINISISERGFFVDGERLNMLEYRFREIFRSKSNFYYISENKPSFQNCAIFYVHSNDMAYIDTMDIWFTPDDSPFTKKDFDRLEKFYADSATRFNEQNHKYILSANIHLDILKKIGPGKNLTFHDRLTLATLLDLAIVANNPKICEFLIGRGFDVNYINGYGADFSSLNLARAANALEAGKILVKHGAKYDLFACITANSEECYIEKLEFLLKCGANPNEGLKNDFFTPLMWAVNLNNIPAAKVLIKYGADVNAKTFCEGTALRLAVYLDYIEMASLLIEHGAHLNSMTDGRTNLLHAIMQESPDKTMISLLSLCGGKINADLPVPFQFYNKKLNMRFVVNEALVPFFLKEDEEAFLFLWKLFLLFEKL